MNRFDTRAAEGKDEWLTPPDLLRTLGSPDFFDLDPCAPVNRPWPTAREHFTILDNGLLKPWHGRVWLNPPYGPETPRWMARLREHGNGIALVFARTDTATFHDHVWPAHKPATAVLFLRNRLTFHHVTGKPAPGNGGAPSCLIAFGEENAQRLEAAGLEGRCFRLHETARPTDTLDL